MGDVPRRSVEVTAAQARRLQRRGLPEGVEVHERDEVDYYGRTPMDCAACGFTLGAGMGALPLCPGPKEERSTLERGRPLRRESRLREVSPDRGRKRSSSVAGEKLVFTEAATWARDQGCFLRFWREHRCESYPGRAALERAHLDRRAKGHGDWRAGDGACELRVVGACPKARDALDQCRACDRASAELVHALAETYAEALTARCPVDPPKHVVMGGPG